MFGKAYLLQLQDGAIHTSFFSDGSYIFNYSTMDCAKRTIRHSGEYKFESDNTILLITKNKTIVEGGKLVPAMGSCGSEFELEDGIVKEIQLANHENNKLSISSISLDQEAKEKMTINGTGFWRFSKDPLFYNSHSY